jgi:predicted dehydrogenase
MKIAVLGLGFMGLTHIKALKHVPQAELVAVASDDDRMDSSGLRKYHDWRQAVLDSESEAVDICLPTHLHASATIAALRAGKHVLVEKPMALDGDEADAMIEAARSTRRLLMVAQVLRFFPAYRALEDVLKSGRLGPVRAATFRRRSATPDWGPWFTNKRASGGGVFDMMLHDVDMILHLFGQPQAVSASGYEGLSRGIDWIAAQFHYPGLSVALSGGWHPSATYPFSMEYSVVTDNGVVEFNSATEPPALYPAGGNKVELPLSLKDGYQAEIEYFIKCCTEGTQPVLCPPVESARAVRLARVMLAARMQPGERIPWKSE